MARYNRTPLAVNGHRLRLGFEARIYEGGDGRQHTEHMARCVQCGARARVTDLTRVEWTQQNDQGGCRGIKRLWAS